jgi:predicted pyridoxine 5'-phosphate oxidase superfamily flavin-nucleotide-binding protein
MARKYLELSVTPAVRAAQGHYYGRAQSFPANPASASTPLGADETAFIAERDSFYVATVSETGWPYVQHRGGPKGFLRVLDRHTLAFADFGGNRQLLSTGNLAAGNDRIALFLMDYPQRARLKIMGHARVLDARDDPALTKKVGGERSELVGTERVFVIEIVSFDWNCSQHITPRYTEEEIETAVAAPLRARIAELEARLHSAAAKPH